MGRRLALLACAPLLAACLGAPPPATAQAPPGASATVTGGTGLGAPLGRLIGPTTPPPPARAPAPVSPAQARAEGLETPVPVSTSTAVRPGRRLSSAQVLAIADRIRSFWAVRFAHRGSFGGVYLRGPGRWQVSYFSRSDQELAQAVIADSSGRVLEAWTGIQVGWSMARGYPGAFGRHVNALYVWLPLCALFLAPFIDWRRPLSLLHLDLLVLLSFSISLAFFNHGRIYQSVPLVYPPLVYLLARCLWIARPGAGARRRHDAAPDGSSRPPRGRPPRIWAPAWLLLAGAIFLAGFRVALNVTDSNVIDVGYAGVIGADRIAGGQALYGTFPQDNEHGDTYGPVNYEAYVPFEQALGWSGRWDELPAAHAAAIAFDLLAMALLYLLGRRVRGPTLGAALAYGWAAYPFTLFALESNANDTLVAVLLLGALLLAASPPARGALAALAGLTKFAPFAVAPLLASHNTGSLRAGPRARQLSLFCIALAATAGIASIPALSHNSLATIWRRAVLYQVQRESPFSIWGLYGLPGLRLALAALAGLLAVGLAVVRRRDDLVGLAAACAAVLIAVQLAMEHWFYLYIPWFFPLVLLAVFSARLERAGALEEVLTSERSDGVMETGVRPLGRVGLRSLFAGDRSARHGS